MPYVDDVWVSDDYEQPESLIIERYLPSGADHRTSNFTFVAKKVSPNYDRGRKYKTDYMTKDGSRLMVSKQFSDIEVAGVLTGLTMLIQWISEDESVGDSKSVTIPLNLTEAETMLRKRRERSMDYLKSSADSKGVLAYVKAVLDAFDAEKQQFLDGFPTSWVDAMAATPTEVGGNPNPIYAILKTGVPRDDDPTRYLTVEQSILYQLHNLDLSTVDDQMTANL